MKAGTHIRSKITERASPAERGYDVWKQAKIERGLAQADDRNSLIPLEKILRDFGLER